MTYLNKYIIRPSPAFEKELEKIYNYITFELKEPLTAKKFFNQLSKEIYSLQYFPERYKRIPIYKKPKRNIRKLPFNNYVIIYEVDINARASIYFAYISQQSKLFKSFIIF